MSLTDRARARPSPPVHGAPCSVGGLLDTLPDEEAEALHHMLDSPDWPASKIHEAVLAEGLSVGRQTIGTHRRRQCRCYPRETT